MADEETIDWIQNFDCYPSPHPWWIAAFIVTIVAVIFNATFILCNVKHLFIKPAIKRNTFIKQRANKFFYLLIITFYTIGPFIYFLADCLQLRCKTTFYWYVFSKGTALQIMTLSTEMLYLFYVLRIKRLFEEIPDLKFSNFQLYFFYFGFMTQIICQSVSYFYYFLCWDDFSNFKNCELALKFSYGALSFYCIFIVTLLSMFCYKVYQLLHHEDTIQSEPRNNAANFAVRYLWLAAIALFSSMLYSIVSVFRSSEGMKMSVIMVKNIFLVTDTMVNVICLYLQFEWANRWYFSMCNFCHVGWIKVFGLTNTNDKKKKTEMKMPTKRESTGTTGFTATGDTATIENMINLCELETLSHGSNMREMDNLIKEDEPMDNVEMDNVEMENVSPVIILNTERSNKKSATVTWNTTGDMDISTRLYVV